MLTVPPSPVALEGMLNAVESDGLENIRVRKSNDRRSGADILYIITLAGRRAGRMLPKKPGGHNLAVEKLSKGRIGTLIWRRR
jgi:hypothetical protein